MAHFMESVVHMELLCDPVKILWGSHIGHSAFAAIVVHQLFYTLASLLVRRSGPLTKTNVKTLPYPGFPTDMQPQITAVLALAAGTSLVTEGVYGANRFKYVDELKRLGAHIQVDGKVAVVEGVKQLVGAPIQACDLRAGAALVIAGLAAQGTTELSHINYIERGYEDLVGKLRAVGADISLVDVPDEADTETHAG